MGAVELIRHRGRHKARFTCPGLCTVLWDFCERHFSTNLRRPSMMYLLHHDCDAFELCHALWAMRVTRRPPPKPPWHALDRGCVCHLHKQSTGLFSPRPRGIACYTLIEGSSTAPKHARMRAHGVWRVQTVPSDTQESESKNCVECATICKNLKNLIRSTVPVFLSGCSICCDWWGQ